MMLCIGEDGDNETVNVMCLRDGMYEVNARNVCMYGCISACVYACMYRIYMKACVYACMNALVHV